MGTCKCSGRKDVASCVLVGPKLLCSAHPAAGGAELPVCLHWDSWGHNWPWEAPVGSPPCSQPIFHAASPLSQALLSWVQ